MQKLVFHITHKKRTQTKHTPAHHLRKLGKLRRRGCVKKILLRGAKKAVSICTDLAVIAKLEEEKNAPSRMTDRSGF